MKKSQNNVDETLIDAWGVDHSKLPVATETDYHKDEDVYIIEYQEVRHVTLNSDVDTDFTENITVEEASRVNRQDYLNEQSGDVGILNILKKMALSGDTSLLNQTHRASIPGSDKDALGRAVEDIVDISNYQVDRIAALESYKKGADAYHSLDPDLKGKSNLEEVAKLSDAEIDSYIENKVKAYYAKVAELKAASAAESEKK